MAYWFKGWRLVIWLVVAFFTVVYLFSQTLVAQS
jgi:hypothetical protein